MPAFLVLPDQLFAELSRLPKGTVFYIVESEWHLRRLPIHKQKLVLYRAAMQAVRERLLTKGFRVEWCELAAYPTILSVFRRIAKDGQKECDHYFIPDHPLAQEVQEAAKQTGIALTEVESPLFISSTEWLSAQFQPGVPTFATFYTAIRRQATILLDAEGKPAGGQWSFANPENHTHFAHFPTVPVMEENRYTEDAIKYVEKHFPKNPGDTTKFNYPVTHNDSLDWLDAFLEERLAQYAQGNEYISTKSATVFHSALSPLLNIGLLTSSQVLRSALRYAEENAIPLVSLEAFIRQLIGRREYCYGLYRALAMPAGKAGVKRLNEQVDEFLPVNTAIKRLQEKGYLQPAERQMLHIFMILLGLSPRTIHDFFMTYCVDGAEWALVPHVYSNQPIPYLADTILRKSDYPAGNWVDDWNCLYWHHVSLNQKELVADPRQVSVVKQLRKLPVERLEYIQKRARHLIKEYTTSAGVGEVL